jgi:hypothetical protein
MLEAFRASSLTKPLTEEVRTGGTAAATVTRRPAAHRCEASSAAHQTKRTSVHSSRASISCRIAAAGADGKIIKRRCVGLGVACGGGSMQEEEESSSATVAVQEGLLLPLQCPRSAAQKPRREEKTPTPRRFDTAPDTPPAASISVTADFCCSRRRAAAACATARGRRRRARLIPADGGAASLGRGARVPSLTTAAAPRRAAQA